MIRARRWQLALGMAVALSALLSWGAPAKAQTYSVNYAAIKLYIKYQDGDMTRKEMFRTNDAIREALDLDPDERIPREMKLAVLIACGTPYPDIVVVVWNSEEGGIEGELFGLETISSTYDESSSGDLRRMYLYGREAEDGIAPGPMDFAGMTRMRWEDGADDYCAGSGKVGIIGAFAPDVLFDGAWLKWGNAKDFLAD